MKTINYELAKKLYGAGVVIESEFEVWESWKLFKRTGIKYDWAYPTLTIEEAIEFLLTFSSLSFRKWLYLYSIVCWENFVNEFSTSTLLEWIEATLEYLFDNGYIWKNTGTK